MMTVLVNGALMLAAVSCQQADRREARGDVSTIRTTPAPVPTPDEDVRAAQVELAEGNAWLATRRVTPAIRSPERRTPEAVLVGARAAAAWKGWTLVNAMLAFEPWLDTRFAGEGRELLARSALERGEATAARDHAEAALRAPGDASAKAVRLVLLARALDRLDVRDSAAASYRRAAAALPAIREWLMLRAAGATADAAVRERIYRDIRDSAAVARVGNTEALALERFGMQLAAATAYEKLGDMASAYRLRLSAEGDAALRSGLRAGLLGYIQRDARGDNLQRAIEVLDAAFPDLDPTSELLVARRAAEGGLQARAASGYAKVAASQLTDADVIAWARALIAAGRPTEAATRISRRTFGTAALAEAQYVRGLARIRAGSTSNARIALQRVLSAYGTTSYAADAMYLLADLESDAGRESRARDLMQRACVHPRPGGFSDDACFHAGVLSYALGDARRAAASFDELPKRFPNSGEALAATYWAGRSYERLTNTELARERWTTVMQREPLSYYASRSAARLGTPQSLPAASAIPPSSEFQPALRRAELLEYLGMETEERHEYDAVERAAATQPARALAAGAMLLERTEAIRAIRLGWRAVGVARTARDSGGPADDRAYGLVYPLFHEVELVARARENNLDPALVAAVIRQESSWHPRAVSRAGARGLMQIMPVVGEAIARSRGYPTWDPALLFEPTVSLELGSAHLRAALSSYSSLPRALAAYNAGGSRVRRWVRRTGAGDPELFVERIPFVETRDYVRIVMRNAELYRALHGLKK
jgi:soluble lytic murein transglycosylase